MKKKPFLTIGMACHTDYMGVYFSIQAIKLYFQDILDEIEIIVIDNDPKGSHGAAVKSFMSDWNQPIRHKYIPFEESEGTTQTRQKVIDSASGEFVLCMDCHVMFWPESIRKLIDYYKANPNTKNLYTGPIVYDNLEAFATHFDPVWRAEMWGIWSNAWESKDGTHFCVRAEGENGCSFHRLVTGEKLTELDGRAVPNIAMAGHQQHLKNLGFRLMAEDLNDDPFEIPAQGLGIFSCKKSEWLGFNPEFRGFGGEECYIHEKYRQHGRKTICLPFLRWNHRFGRPDGVPYTLNRHNKVRNYVLGHQELGLDLKPVHDHFVKTNLYSQYEWDKLVKDAQNFKESQPKNIPSTHIQPEEDVETLDDMFDFLKTVQRDLNNHFDILKELSSECDKVAEITNRRESSIALLAGKPKLLLTYTSEDDTLHNKAEKAVTKLKNGSVTWQKTKPNPVKHGNKLVPVSDDIFFNHVLNHNLIIDVDMLLLNTIQSEAHTYRELAILGKKVNNYIVITNTMKHFAKSADGKTGLKNGVERWLNENPEWYVYKHYDHQNGLTVLSKIPEKKPKRKIRPWPPGYGCGTELKKLLSKIGIESTPNCACNARAINMDRLGYEWCEENKDTILKWLKEEATRRKIPLADTKVFDFGANKIINLSIKRGKKAQIKEEGV